MNSDPPALLFFPVWFPVLFHYGHRTLNRPLAARPGASERRQACYKRGKGEKGLVNARAVEIG